MHLFRHDYRSDFYLENARNIMTRHCRIANVRNKAPAPVHNPTIFRLPRDAPRWVNDWVSRQQPLGVDLGDLESMYE